MRISKVEKSGHAVKEATRVVLVPVLADCQVDAAFRVICSEHLGTILLFQQLFG